MVNEEANIDGQRTFKLWYEREGITGMGEKSKLS